MKLQNPRIEIDIQKLVENTKVIVDLCRKNGIEVAGVTKGVTAIPQVAQAMVDGGVSILADSRIRNIRKLRESGISIPMMMIRIPRMSRVREIVENTDFSLNSELGTMRALHLEASHRHRKHKMILMIDVGDLREGIFIPQGLKNMERIVSQCGNDLIGVGTNVGCYGGVLPTLENMNSLVEIAKYITGKWHKPISIISVGGSNALYMIERGQMPKEINQLRVGEAILLGRDSSRGRIIHGTWQDTFVLAAEIIELKMKPSVPIGKISRDAFGRIPKFPDKGVRKRAIIALGRQDVRLDGLKPMDEGVSILGGSSDHIILDVTDAAKEYRLGDEIKFQLLYPALLAATTSPYVNIYYKEENTWKPVLH